MAAQVGSPGRGIFPGRCPQVTVGQLEQLWKCYTAKEKYPLCWRVKSESDRN